jgi:type I restriction enzyme S subunit
LILSNLARHRVDELINTGALAVGDGYRAKNNELSDSGVPFARAANINNGFRFTNTDRFPVEALPKVGEKLSQPGDVVFTSKGTVGRFAFVTDEVEPFVFSPQLCYWRSLDPDRINSRYLYYWLSGPEFAAQYTSVKGQTDMADYVSLRDQRRMVVTLPRLDEQRAIARVLGALDDKIDLNRRIAATARELAHAIFRSRYRSDDPELPHEPLGAHLDVARGLSYTGAGLADEGMPLHNLNSIYEGGGYNRAGIKHFAGQHKERHVVVAGDVVVANTDLTWNYRVIASAARIPRCFGESGLFSHHLYRVRPRTGSSLSPTFIYLMLLPGKLRSEIVGYANGTTVNMLPVDALQKPRFAVPPEALVEEIDALVTPLFDRAEAAEDESETLAELRDTLLPKLISGELRVRDAETTVENAT